jgi:hypothetical protein
MTTKFRRRCIAMFLAAVAAISSTAAQAVEFQNETLSYRVTYKWGLIQKVAGSASLTLTKQPSAGKYKAVLVARSLPWADKIFSVRDTLSGTMDAATMHPLHYDKSTHEGGVYRHDVIHYTYSGSKVTGKCRRHKVDKKNKHSVTDTMMTATAPAVDMLSVYYLVRNLPFESMKVGDVSRSTLFSGKKLEKLALKYDGITTIKLNGTSYECYKISFTFSSERMNNSSAPMTAWIWREGSRIPIKLVGELAVGEVQVLWNGEKKEQ